MKNFTKKIQNIVGLMAIALFCFACSNVPSTSSNPWKVISLDTDSSFADVAFSENANHGWLVGTHATLLETNDGGDSWQERQLALGDENISFNGISFEGKEGWIVGEPAILLHTEDGGDTWSRIPLSEKLPGIPYNIHALGPQTAEMVTNLGAIYRTTNGGRNWKALVEGAVGVARNISRSDEGRYVAVSARGNFYSIWEPGQSEWTGHNRNSSRRLQNMGFTDDERIWLIARGGQLQFSGSEADEDWGDPIYPEFSASWGLLDLAYRSPEEVWIAGGSGNLFVSHDGGQTWEKDRAVEDVPSNFYRIVFNSAEKGFVLGERGYLLKYDSTTEELTS